MKISFGEKVINATVYIKLIAPDQLLLSEEVCHMLGIVSYHPSVKFVDKSQPVVDVSCAMQPKGPISCNSEASVGDHKEAVNWPITKYQPWMEIILILPLLRLHYQVRLADSLVVMNKLL